MPFTSDYPSPTDILGLIEASDAVDTLDEKGKTTLNLHAFSVSSALTYSAPKLSHCHAGTRVPNVVCPDCPQCFSNTKCLSQLLVFIQLTSWK